jgi:serine/threonine protein kinase
MIALVLIVVGLTFVAGTHGDQFRNLVTAAAAQILNAAGGVETIPTRARIWTQRHATDTATNLRGDGPPVRAAISVLLTAGTAVAVMRADFTVLEKTLMAMFAPTALGTDNAPISPKSGVGTTLALGWLLGVALLAHWLTRTLDERPTGAWKQIGRVGKALLIIGLLGGALVLTYKIGVFRAQTLGEDITSPPQAEAIRWLAPYLPLLFTIVAGLAGAAVPEALFVLWLVVMGVSTGALTVVDVVVTNAVKVIRGVTTQVVPRATDLLVEVSADTWSFVLRRDLRSPRLVASPAPPAASYVDPVSDTRSYLDGVDAEFVVADRWACLRPLPEKAQTLFNTLWVGRDIWGEHGGDVVIKLYRPSTESTFGERAIRREWSYGVVSPHVAPILDGGDDTAGSGYLYLVTPYFARGNLRTVYNTTPNLTFRWGVDVAAQVILGLDASWGQRRIVHLDVTPSNIVVADDGSIRLIDFGLIEIAIEDGATATMSGDTLHGSLYYAAPETWLRKGTCSPLTAIYSVGAVLYFLLTGYGPYEKEGRAAGSTFAEIVLSSVCNPELSPTPVRELNPNVPESLAELVTRWLSFTPADRVPTAMNADEVYDKALNELTDVLKDISDGDGDAIGLS